MSELKPASENRIRVKISLTPEEYRRLIKAAEKDQARPATLARDILCSYLDAHPYLDKETGTVLRDFTRQIRRVGVLLNQVARYSAILKQNGYFINEYPPDWNGMTDMLHRLEDRVTRFIYEQTRADAGKVIVVTISDEAGNILFRKEETIWSSRQ